MEIFKTLNLNLIGISDDVLTTATFQRKTGKKCAFLTLSFRARIEAYYNKKKCIHLLLTWELMA